MVLKMSSLHVSLVIKRHYGECKRVTKSCYGCGKEGHKGRDCPIIASKGRERKKVLAFLLLVI